MGSPRFEKSEVILTTKNGFEHKIPTMFYSLLMQHQKISLAWLLDHYAHGTGAILADEMGLGKTISAISLLVALNSTFGEGRQFSTLIVCPATVVSQWREEIRLWTSGIQQKTTAFKVFDLQSSLKWQLTKEEGEKSQVKSQNPSSKEKIKILKHLDSHGGILIISYEGLRIEAKILRETLNWFYVILDEA